MRHPVAQHIPTGLHKSVKVVLDILQQPKEALLQQPNREIRNQEAKQKSSQVHPGQVPTHKLNKACLRTGEGCMQTGRR